MAKAREMRNTEIFQQVGLTDKWFGLYTPDSGIPEPYEWFMERVIGFVCRRAQNGRLELRGLGCHGGEFPEFTHYVFGKDRAKGDQRWIDIYNAAEDGFLGRKQARHRSGPKNKGVRKGFQVVTRVDRVV